MLFKNEGEFSGAYFTEYFALSLQILLKKGMEHSWL